MKSWLDYEFVWVRDQEDPHWSVKRHGSFVMAYYGKSFMDAKRSLSRLLKIRAEHMLREADRVFVELQKEEV